jgi:DNA phosphorothioation-dependent restriction protein DptG
MGRVRKPNENDAGLFEVLHLEHTDVSALFEQIEAMLLDGSPSEARDLFTVLRDSLLAHAKAEEAVVYPRFMQIKAIAEKMQEAEAEHGAVEMLIERLDGRTPDDEQWLAELKVLQENVQHHVKEEEGEIFESAKEEIEAAESKRLAASFLQAKARRTGEPETEQARERKAGKKRGLLARLFGRA